MPNINELEIPKEVLEQHIKLTKMYGKMNKSLKEKFRKDDECIHDWVKIVNINKTKVWYCIFIYANDVRHEEKFVCLKCGKEIR